MSITSRWHTKLVASTWKCPKCGKQRSSKSNKWVSPEGKCMCEECAQREGFFLDTPDPSDIDGRIIKIIVDTLGVNPSFVKDTSALIDLAADPLDAIELCFNLEEEFTCDIDFDKWSTVDLTTFTVGRIKEIVKDKLKKECA